MPRSRSSVADQSYKLRIELIPLYAFPVPERSRKRFAKNPPRAPLLLKDVTRHISDLTVAANASPLVFVSRSSIGKILDSLRMRISRKELLHFNREINGALLEYQLRLYVERAPLSSWLPRYQEIVGLLRRLRALLPDREKDPLLFNIIRRGRSKPFSKPRRSSWSTPTAIPDRS
jgi:hypothetical protein